MTFEDLTILLENGVSGLTELKVKKKWEEVYNDMLTHSRGAVPKNLIKENFPNEPSDIRKYREDTFQPITQDPYYRGFCNFYRALSESKYSIVAPDYLKAYLKTLRVNNVPFWQFLFKKVLWRKFEDPNGVIVHKVTNIGGQNKRLEYSPELILSKNIVYQSEDIFIYKDSKNDYCIVTDLDYATFNEKSGEVTLTYSHNIGRLPVTVLEGIQQTCWIEDVEYPFYASDLSSFTAHANLALLNMEIHKAAVVTTGFAIRVMTGLKCKAPGCFQGRIVDDKGIDCGVCKTCNGHGELVPVSQFKGIMLSSNTAFDKGGKPLEFVHPDPAIITMTYDLCEKELTKSERALSMRFIDMAESGVAKQFTEADKSSMLYGFSDSWYDGIVRDSLYFAHRLIFREKGEPEISIIKPINFKIPDEMELLEEYKIAVEKELSFGLIRLAYFDYIRKRFAGDGLNLKIEELAVMIDTFYLLPFTKLVQLKTLGQIDDSQFQKTLNLNNTIQLYVSEIGSEKFMDMDFNKLAVIIKERLVEFEVQEKDPIFAELNLNGEETTE